MKISVKALSSKTSKADVFFVGSFKGEKTCVIKKAETGFAKNLENAISKKRFGGKSGESFASYQNSFVQANEVVALGLGEKDKFSVSSLRKIVGSVAAAAQARKAKTIRVFLDSFLSEKISAKDAVKVLAETAILAAYRFDAYKAKKKENVDLDTLEVVTEDKKLVSEAGDILPRTEKIANAVILARDLNNEPGNVMNAARLSKEAAKIAREKKLKFKSIGEAELKKLGMNGILAVNQGSVTPPALIIMEYGEQYKKNGTICLLGKGVTFDTGGISIKPSKSMEEMKYDKSGAVTVIATMGLLADFKLKLHIVGLAPTVENNVANNPQRPGDIIKMYNGKTVEVMNTDAEGRLILADTLSYCKKYNPTAILDVATLTGMCHYTFGDKTCGILGTDQKLMDAIIKAGETTGERCWQLPLWDEYADAVKAHHSDLKNVGDGFAGTITAAMFLKEFVPENTPWVHLDIAGTAYASANKFDCVKGATGYGVRLFVELLSNWKKDNVETGK